MPPDLSRTGVLGATTAVAGPPTPRFQRAFPQAFNSFANPPNNARFARSIAIPSTTGIQQPQRSASVPRQSQMQVARGNPPVSAHQLALLADEEHQIDENIMLIEKEEPRSLVDESISDDWLCMHPSPGLVRSLFWSPIGIQDRLRWA